MSLDALLRLQAGYNDQTMQGINQLSETVGNIFQQRGQRSFEQNAMEFFKDGDISPEKLQQFGSMYPQLPQQLIWQYASAIGGQRKTQNLKNGAKNYADWWIGKLKKGEQPTEQEHAAFWESQPDDVRADFPQHMEAFTKVYGPKIIEAKKGTKLLSVRGGKATDITPPGMEEEDTPSEWVQNEQGNQYFVTKKNAAALVATGKYKKYEKEGKEGGLAYHIEKESIGDKLTQDYRVFTDKQGNVVKRGKVGVPYANTEGVAQIRIQGGVLPQQTQFTDPVTGKPLIYDKQTGTYRVSEIEGGGGIAPRPVNPSATEREKTAGIETIKHQLQKIKDTYKQHPEFVGVVSGQVGRVSQLWDAKEAAFRQKILDVKDALLRARSGAQINEQEYQRLSKLVPDMGDSDAMFEGKMASFEESLNMMTEQRTTAQGAGGVYNRTGKQGVVVKRPLSAY